MKVPAASTVPTASPAPVSAPILPGRVYGPVPGETAYYGVTSSPYAGIYTDWSTISALLNRFPDLKFKKHTSYSLAEEAMEKNSAAASLIDMFDSMSVRAASSSAAQTPSRQSAASPPRQSAASPPRQSSTARSPQSPARQPSAVPPRQPRTHQSAAMPPRQPAAMPPRQPAAATSRQPATMPAPPYEIHPNDPYEPGWANVGEPWGEGEGEWDGSENRPWPSIESQVPGLSVGLLQAPVSVSQPDDGQVVYRLPVYAVARGWMTGIFFDLERALQQTHRFPNALMVKFHDTKSAGEWLAKQWRADLEALGEN
ncbi:hypothetical protein FA95DRAFT_1613602 [Auriscalpium vulgare]|uniref:Uncharacterized protein n=1 Tax=Auriscalpium vulgare TaxID=40419 RepID=A0ACB8R2Q0_9AGAM|nr:hypothetical protein FA95DRAFT_1613602 [Auriscalpium vulgare]